MGIDGWSFFERLPIQVKQSDSVGRKVVDEFETAIARSRKHKGFIVAFSFTSGAYEEAARTKETDRAVHLVKVADLLRVAELIERAEVTDETVNLSRETPALLDLFERVGGRAHKRWPPPPPPQRSAKELIKNVRAEGAGINEDGPPN
jgi:Restriction endonuclease